jgi:branched-chain amino acid transport system ATP-binding protein
MTRVLALDDAKVWFGGVKAVDGVTLEIGEGRLHGLVGPNGSGKTTLINAMTRLTRLTSGSIEFGGEDATHWPPHRAYRAGLARTFQGIRLLSGLTVRENIALGADEKLRASRPSLGRRPGRSPSLAAADEALRRLDLAHVANVAPDQLPYGTQRRVEIARALAGRPRLLLLDEPVAGMSGAERAEIADVLRLLRGEGLTLLLIEHDLAMVLALSDHLFVMNFGKLIAEGDPHRTAALPQVQEAYLGHKHAAA